MPRMPAHARHVDGDGPAPRVQERGFVSIDVSDEANQVLARHYNLSKIPTFVCVENNVPRSSFSGADPVALRRLIETGRS